MVRRSFVIVKCGDTSHRLDIAHRDWLLLFGPFFREGERFARELGVYEHFTVAGGMPKGSYVTRSKWTLLQAAELLLRGIQRDTDLLRYDYSFSFESRSGRRERGAESGFRVRGFIGQIDTRPNGYCGLQLSQIVDNSLSRIIEWTDMRIRGSIETDELGLLRIHRRKADMQWLETLPPLVEFLKEQQERNVVIEHYDQAI